VIGRSGRRVSLALGLLATVAVAIGGYRAANAATGPVVAAATTSAAAQASTSAVPHTVVLDGTDLVQVKQRLAKGTASAGEKAAFTALKQAADADLTAGPWAVTDKTQAPDQGTKHDYYSQAPYWWPSQPKTASNPFGCPYVRRDGQHNPDVDKISDHDERALVIQAVNDLALAWFYTGDSRYAQRAELDVRTWFINSETRMNPSMKFAQGIPCQVTGRPEGIIEVSDSFTSVVDALALLDSGAPKWTSADRAAMAKWLTTFLYWMQTSDLGKQESAALNNHGTWKDQQDAAIALYLGKVGTARTILTHIRDSRIPAQIQADGGQPLELSRTRSWHYSNFNATALCRSAELGRHADVDIWSYQAPSGAHLTSAVDFLIGTAEKGLSAWKYQEIGPFEQSNADYLLHAAAIQGHDSKAAAAVLKVPAPPAPGDMWPVEPACIPLFDLTASTG
jgi:hypothetical protein